MTAFVNVPTLTTCDRSIQLKTIAESGACEAARVIMLDLSLVREKVGARWDARRQAIWDHTERTIRRHVRPTDIACRADQTRYVVSFSETDGFAAQALGFRIMDDVTTHFLGTCSSNDLVVKTVLNIGETEILATPAIFRPEYLTAPISVAGLAQPELPVASMPAMVYLIDGELQQAIGFEHVFNVKIDKPIALRIASCLSNPVMRRQMTMAEQANLSTRNLLQADVNTFCMLDYIFTSMPPKLVIAPVSLQTTTNSKSRSALLDFMNRLDNQMRGRFIVEVYGLEDGTPVSRLKESMALLRPFCRSVMARITPGRSAISNARAAGLPAVNACAPDTGGNPAKLAANLLTMGEAVRGVAPLMMVSDLPDRGFLSVCAVAGFTHAAVRGSPLHA